MKNNFKRILSPKGLEIVFKNHGGTGNRIQLLRSVRNQNNKITCILKPTQ